MVASVTSPADVLNLTLSRLGYKRRVGDLYEGSDAARLALTIYAQARDSVLRSSDWGFAEAFAAAVASGSSAPAPWSLEFRYPVDCLRVRDLFDASYLTDKNNPLPVLWTIGNNAALARVIWTNSVTPTICYTRQVTNPASWDPLFVNLVALELGKQLTASLNKSLDALKPLMEEEQAQIPIAVDTLG